MGRFIEEEDDFDGADFEDDTDGFSEDSEVVAEARVPDERSQARSYTERRRRIEDLIEASRLRDELGLYEDDLFAS